MHTLDTIPPEVRLKIFEQYMQDLDCKLALYIKTSCFNHHPEGNGSGAIIDGDVRLSVTFTPKSQQGTYRTSRPVHTWPPVSRNEQSFYSSLLSSNQKLRREFIDYLGKTLHLDVLSGGAPGDSCVTIGRVSDFVPKSWKDSVKTIEPILRGRFVKLQTSLSDGFSTLRKVVLPDEALGAEIGSTVEGHSSILPDIDVGPLKIASEDDATEVFSEWLQEFDSTPSRGSGAEWESRMTVGLCHHSFGGNNRHYASFGGYVADLLVKKEANGRITTTFQKKEYYETPRCTKFSTVRKESDGRIIGTFHADAGYKDLQEGHNVEVPMSYYHISF
ncbi:uncharacterized protein AB675_4937 [Cyphellophora attinorum]|uniref:Uncharacterized protein n=1 Tax=Cyphellophora attinorum TaxID=1664694 RepID=A0A0N0NHE3_9EURO|nr:uncharacterized protein AB675_4937 [Phialophora attinorum]KPI34591.1 hypothetical protein AB675_4937 [Phialophora attinorum]